MIKEIMISLLLNPIFLATALSWVAAQLIKCVILLIKGGGDFRRLLTGGGMPSSHTATAFGLMISTFIWCGTGGFEAVMALFFMIIVVYDALNVRYITGEQSKILNHLIRKGHQEEDAFYADKKDNLKELVGHTLPEVIAGALVGTAVAVILYAAAGSVLVIH